MNDRSAIMNCLKNKLIAISDVKAVYIERETWADVDHEKLPCLFVVSGPENIEPQTNKEDLSTWELTIFGVDIASSTPQTQLNDLIDNVRSKLLTTDQYLENDSEYTQYIDGGNGLVALMITEILDGIGETYLDEPQFGVSKDKATFKMTIQIAYTSHRE